MLLVSAVLIAFTVKFVFIPGKKSHFRIFKSMKKDGMYYSTYSYSTYTLCICAHIFRRNQSVIQLQNCFLQWNYISFTKIFSANFLREYPCSDVKDSLSPSILEVQCRSNLGSSVQILVLKVAVDPPFYLDFKLALTFNLVFFEAISNLRKEAAFPFSIRRCPVPVLPRKP